jgi:predicted DNA-binding protein (MmcQ/YjbR family)
MNIEDFREYCLSFNGVTEGYPFDEDTLVFKVMDKMFAMVDVESFKRINLKCDPVKAAMLRDLYPEVTPGYHMNKRHWNSIFPGNGELPASLTKAMVKHSYELVVAKLPQKTRKQLQG